MNFPENYKIINHHFERVLTNYISPKTELAPELWQAMRYSCLNGGKRLRPLLVYLTGETFEQTKANLDPIAIAVELMHCYSLIHDDLPAMDDDDLRRGRPTCHIEFNEATAILAGDALQSLAFNILSKSHSNWTAQQQLQIIRSLASASGPNGMAAGQALDLAATGNHSTLEELKLIHRLKTGALIVACVHMAGIACGRSQDELSILINFAEHLGLTFQIKDDILDVVSSTADLGKPQGSDAQLAKATFVRILGLENAEHALLISHEATLAALEPLGDQGKHLHLFAEHLFHRKF